MATAGRQGGILPPLSHQAGILPPLSTRQECCHHSPTRRDYCHHSPTRREYCHHSPPGVNGMATAGRQGGVLPPLSAWSQWNGNSGETDRNVATTSTRQELMEWQQRGDREAYCHHSPPGRHIATTLHQGGILPPLHQGGILPPLSTREEYCHHSPPGRNIATTLHQESVEWQQRGDEEEYCHHSPPGRNIATALHPGGILPPLPTRSQWNGNSRETGRNS